MSHRLVVSHVLYICMYLCMYVDMYIVDIYVDSNGVECSMHEYVFNLSYLCAGINC